MSILQGLKNKLGGGNTDEEDEKMLDFDSDIDFDVSMEKDVKITKNIDKLSDIDVKYPLIKPFAYAHVKWDEEQKEVIYHLEEPSMDEEERETYELIKENLSEKLDVSLSAMQSREKVIGYLEEKIDELLVELGIKMEEERHNKIMYYIFRDFVGLGKIEPFMHDPYIEDLGADGTGIPVFAVHSEFGSVKSDVVYEEEEQLKNLVIKLAERAGKYVSYANPLLDGALPDGSRVNASLTSDVTAHGPTFSIRKFQETPFSAVNMMDLGTANAELMAYMWIIEQYQQSYLITGGTATGKCIAPDDKIHLGNGNIVEAEKLHEEVKDNHEPRKFFTMHENLHVGPKKVNKFYRLENNDEVYKVKTSRGAEITVTPEHPFIVNRDGEICKIEAENINKNDFVAAPRKLQPDTKIQKIQPLDHDIVAYARGAESLVKDIFDERSQTVTEIADELGRSQKAVSEWQYRNSIPWMTLEKLVEDSSFSKEEAIERVKGMTSMHSSKTMNIPRKVTSELAAFVGYIISDGNIHGNYVYFHNEEDKLRQKFQKILGSKFGINAETIKRKDKTPKVQVNSKALREFLKNVFEIPVDSPKARKVSTPEKILKSPRKITSKYLQALFDAEADVSNKQTEITFNTASKDLAEEVVNLLHRHGIIARKKEKQVNEETYYRVKISGKEQNQKYLEEIGFKHPEKNKRAKENIENSNSTHTNVDLVPCKEILSKIKEKENYTNQEIADAAGLGRRTIGLTLAGERTPSSDTISKLASNLEAEEAEKELQRLQELADGDIFWDQLEKIEKISSENAPNFVYDVTVDKSHTFAAGSSPIFIHNTSFLNSTVSFIPPEDKIVSIEDTRELQLPHENWIPSVTRSMFGTTSNSDVDMNQLLKESFRENPDYVIVGEVRGEEASVLFQGMASGHPSIGTMHASGPNDVVKRLVTPPISLSPALVESLDVIVSMTHAKGVKKSARRVRAIHEIQKVIGDSQSARTNEIFSWTARDDSFNMRGEPFLFDKISDDFGISKEKLHDELEKRKKILEWLQDKGVTDFHKVSKIISEYYKSKEDIMKMVNAENPEYSLDDVIEAEQKVDISRPEQLDDAMEAEKPGDTEDLEKEIEQLTGDDPVEKKRKVEDNPVAEIEKKLRDESEKVDDITGKAVEERSENPFENQEQVDDNPFEA